MAELTKTWAGKWKDMQQIIEVSGERGGERKEAAPHAVVRSSMLLVPFLAASVWCRRGN